MALQDLLHCWPCSPPPPWPLPPPPQLEPTGTPCSLLHGTTTLAFRLTQGVVAAADTRSSCGSYVACPASRKVQPIHSRLLATTSGTSADCTTWLRVLRCQLALRRQVDGREPGVAEAAALLSGSLWARRGQGLCVAVALCGWDHTGPSLWYVYSDGTRLPLDVVAVGSGSPYAYGLLDGAYRPDMAPTAAYALARRAVAHAACRDAYSGGSVDVFHVRQSGWVWVSHDDVGEVGGLAQGLGMLGEEEEEEEMKGAEETSVDQYKPAGSSI